MAVTGSRGLTGQVPGPRWLQMGPASGNHEEVGTMKTPNPWRAAGLALGLALLVAPALAQAPAKPAKGGAVLRPSPEVLRSVTLARTANRTRFDPATHGFRFVNSFANNFIPEFDVRTDGLCGGMVYAALDYFNHPEIPLPTQDYEPTDGTTLRTYLYHRQTNSIVDHNHVKWSELSVNPFGSRNAEFYRWGLEGPNGRLDQLKREIDAGRPVPLGLKGCNEGCKGDHQVLAIGYDVGAYTGDMGPALRQVRIFVYDPNFPGRTMTLVPFHEANLYRYAEDHAERWRTYFVNEHYSVRTPPRITTPVREVVLTLTTGGDDLRGGNDNLHVHLLLRDGRTLRFENVNNRRRWVNNSTESVAVPLPDGVSPTDVRGVRLETTFGGGVGGDNWNLDEIWVRGRDEGGTRELYYKGGDPRPLMRFTGDRRSLEVIF